jgi:ATP-binding cassette, subfamily B, bacterial PglK
MSEKLTIFKNSKIIIGKNLSLFILLIVLSILSAVVELFSITLVPIFISSLIDFKSFLGFLPKILSTYATDFDEKTIVITSALIIIIAFILKSSLVFSVIYLELSLFKKIYLTSSEGLFKKYILEPYTNHIKRNKSEIIRNLNEEVVNSSNYIRAILIIARELSLTIGAFILILKVSGIYASPVVLVLMTVSLLFILSIKKKIKLYGEKSIIVREEILDLINYGILSFKVGKILKLSSKLINAFSVKNTQNQNYLFFHRIVSSLPRFVIELVAVIILLGVCVILKIIDSSNVETISLLALISLITIRMIPAFQHITSAFTAIRFYQPSLNLIAEELKETNTEYDISIHLNKKNHEIDKGKFFDKVKIKNLSYKYEGQKKLTLENLSFDFDLNKIIGIYGVSGSGKTTFADILMGLLDKYEGNIICGNLDIKKHPDSWRDFISYVPQESFLIHDSIKNNITFSDNINNSLLYDYVSELAMISEFTDDLSQKEKTIIGKYGFNLSGGQKQRIGIARALYKKPKFLILDESTNSLDLETQELIINRLKKEKNNMTIILISHDLDVIKKCDEVLHFLDGRVVKHSNMTSFLKNLSQNK